MKKVERSAHREKRASALIFIGTLTALVLFGLLLWLAIISIDGANGLYKTSPGAPESLVSLGAPRSQLDLERMFSSMSNTYDEDGKTVYEPVTAGYRESVEKRISAGESFALSVEEILYIISDSVESYDSCDLVRLVRADGSVEREISPIGELSECSKPYYEAANERARDVMAIITHRIFSLSSPDAIEEKDGVYVYTPEYKEKDGARGFVISSEIIFNTDNGRSVRLYPTDRVDETCNSTVLCESKRALSRAEREVLTRSGYDPDACRNITPEYFYGKTELRLVAVGGRVIIVDVDALMAFDPLPREERLASVALFDNCLYFTSTLEGGSALLRYEGGVGVKREASFYEECVGVYGNGEAVEAYAAKKTDSKKYITVLVRTGDPLMTLEK